MSFAAIGEVIPFSSNQVNLRLHNLAAADLWFRENAVDTLLFWPEPLITISARRFVEACRPGDIVAYEIEFQDRHNGRRGVYGVSLSLVRRAIGV